MAVRPLPNVITLFPHDTGDRLGCFGYESVSSPALDAFCGEGVRFANAFCTAPQCSPARASLHTGLYPQSSGVLGLTHSPMNWELKPDCLTLAQLLKQAGYETYAFGQHATHTNARLGFDHFAQIADEAKPEALRDLCRKHAGNSQPFYAHFLFSTTHRPFDKPGIEPDWDKESEVPSFLPDTPEVRADLAAFKGAVRKLDEQVGRLLDYLESEGLAENTWVVLWVDHGFAFPRAKCTLYDAGVKVAAAMRWPMGFEGNRVLTPLVSQVDLLPTLAAALDLPLPHAVDGLSLWPLLQGEAETLDREAIFAQKTYHTCYDPMRCLRNERYKLIVHCDTAPGVDLSTSDIITSPSTLALLASYGASPSSELGKAPLVELYDLQADPAEQHNLAGETTFQPVLQALLPQLVAWMKAVGDPLLASPPRSPAHAEFLRLVAEYSS